MVKFIILTLSNDNEKIYVNPNQICVFYKINDDTVIQFTDRIDYFVVKETPVEIMNMINNLSR